MTAGSDAAYHAKPAAYYANARRDWLRALPRRAELAVLEIGCGSGATGALALSEGLCRRWVGVERHGPAATEAEGVLTSVHAGDVESLELPYPESSFDVLVMGEVLEHLREPAAALIRLAKFVRPGGLALASTPNVGHWRVIAGLALGRFDYEDEGVMDRTHLRWFTPASLAEMFAAAGFTDVAVNGMGWREPLRSISRALPFHHLLWRQIELKAVKRD